MVLKSIFVLFVAGVAAAVPFPEAPCRIGSYQCDQYLSGVQICGL